MPKERAHARSFGCCGSAASLPGRRLCPPCSPPALCSMRGYRLIISVYRPIASTPLAAGLAPRPESETPVLHHRRELDQPVAPRLSAFKQAGTQQSPQVSLRETGSPGSLRDGDVLLIGQPAPSRLTAVQYTAAPNRAQPKPARTRWRPQFQQRTRRPLTVVFARLASRR